METFTRSKTSISTVNICPFQLLAISNLALVFGGVCWICLDIFRGEVCVPMFKCTHGGWVPMLSEDTDASLAVAELRACPWHSSLVTNLVSYPEALTIECWWVYYSWDLSSPLRVLWQNGSCPCTFLHFTPSPPFPSWPSERWKVFYRGKKTCGPWKVEGHRLIREHCSMCMSIRAQHFLLHIGQNQMT